VLSLNIVFKGIKEQQTEEEEGEATTMEEAEAAAESAWRDRQEANDETKSAQSGANQGDCSFFWLS